MWLQCVIADAGEDDKESVYYDVFGEWFIGVQLHFPWGNSFGGNFLGMRTIFQGSIFRVPLIFRINCRFYVFISRSVTLRLLDR